LEIRKKRATDTLDLFTDVIELRGSIKMVKQSLANCVLAGDSKKMSMNGLENLETAAHFMSKSMSLMQVIEKQLTEDNLMFQKDKQSVEALRDQVS
jgi:hypothetical protein